MNQEEKTFKLMNSVWNIIHDYIRMRMAFRSGLEAMPEKSHALTLERANNILTLLENEYPFLQDRFPHE